MHCGLIIHNTNALVNHGPWIYMRNVTIQLPACGCVFTFRYETLRHTSESSTGCGV